MGGGAARRIRGFQAGDQEIGEGFGNFFRVGGALGIEPSGDPVDGSEDGEAEEFRIAGFEDAAIHAFAKNEADAAIESVSLGDDGAEAHGRERLQIEGESNAVELVNNHVNERDDELAQFFFGRFFGGFDLIQEFENEPQRIIVAEIENVFLIFEIIVKVSFGHAKRTGDYVHAGAVIAATSKCAGGAAKNFEAFVFALDFAVLER